MDGRLSTRKSGSASTGTESSSSAGATSDWLVGSFCEVPAGGCASCAAADVHTVSSAAAENTIERWVMANMSGSSPRICVYVPGVTINQAFMRL